MFIFDVFVSQINEFFMLETTYSNLNLIKT